MLYFADYNHIMTAILVGLLTLDMGYQMPNHTFIIVDL